MAASQKRGLKPDELTAGLTGANATKDQTITKPEHQTTNTSVG